MFSGNVRKIATVITAKNDANSKLEDAESAGDSAASSMEGVEQSAEAAGDALDDSGDAASSAGDDIDSAGDSADATADSFVELDAASAAVAGSLAAAGSGMQNMLDATSAVRGEAAIAQGAIEGVDGSVTDMAISISDATFSTEEAVRAIRTFGQLGAESEDDLKTLALAADEIGDATGESSEVIAESVVPAMTMFGDEIEDLPEKTDMFAFAIGTTTMSAQDFNQAITAGSSDLQEMDASSTEATAALVALQQQTNLTGGRLRREFQQRLRDADGDLNAFADDLGMTTEELENFEDEVPEDWSSDMADEYAQTKTFADELRVTLSDLRLQFGEFLTPVSAIAPAMQSAGVALLFYSQINWSQVIPSTQASTAATVSSTAALRAKAATARVLSAAQFVLTASTGQLAAATWTKVTALNASAAATARAAASKLTLTGILGGLTAAKGAAAAAAGALTLALGPVGLALMALTAIVMGLVAIWRTDFLGAGDEAGAVLGWFGDQARAVTGHLRTLGDGLWQIGRIVAMVAALFTLGPIAAFLRFFQNPGKWINAGEEAVGGLLSSFDDLEADLLMHIPGVGMLFDRAGLTPNEAAERGRSMLFGLVDEFRANLPRSLLALIPSVGMLLAASRLAPDDWTEQGGQMIQGLRDRFSSMLPQALLMALPGVGMLMAAAHLAPSEWKDRGTAMIHSLASAMLPDPMVSAIEDVAGRVMSYLPFSDARRGPFSRLTDSGRAIPMTVAEAIWSGLTAPVRAADDMASGIMDALPSVSDIQSAGSSAARGFATGLSSGASDVASSATELASSARDRLPFSDARTGPLSDVSQTGPALASTFATGLRNSDGMLANAADSALSAVSDAADGTVLDPAITATADTLAGQSAGNSTSGDNRRSIEANIEVNQQFTFENGGDEQTADRVSDASQNGVEDALRRLERTLQADLDI